MKKVLLPAVAALGLIGSAAVFADTQQVTQGVTAGSLTVDLSALTLDSKPVSASATDSLASGTISVADFTGSAAGWNVTIESTNFVWDGLDAAEDIPASAFALTSAATPGVVSGDGTNVTVVDTTGTLNTPVATLEAAAGSGEGEYTQAVGLELTIPAYARAGTYEATVTTTVASGPVVE